MSLFKVGRGNAEFEFAAELVRVLVHILRRGEDDFISCFDNCDGGLWIELALEMRNALRIFFDLPARRN